MGGITKKGSRPAWLIAGALLIIDSVVFPGFLGDVDPLFVFGVMLVLKGI